MTCKCLQDAGHDEAIQMLERNIECMLRRLADEPNLQHRREALTRIHAAVHEIRDDPETDTE